MSPLREINGLIRSLTGLGALLPFRRTGAFRLHLVPRRLKASTGLAAVLALQHRGGGTDFVRPGTGRARPDRRRRPSRSPDGAGGSAAR